MRRRPGLVSAAGGAFLVALAVALRRLAPPARPDRAEPAPGAARLQDPCPGAVPWHEAAGHEGRVATVAGPVMGAKYARTSRRGPTFLNIGRPYPERGRLTVVVWGEDRRNFPEPPETAYRGAYLCATGKVRLRGGSPEIHVSSPGQLAAAGMPLFVSRVVDGDTVELSDGRRVRYLGVDTPETKRPYSPVECFGPEAARANRELVEGKPVRLEADAEDRDSYGRLLRYVYVDGVDVSGELIRRGLGRSTDGRFEFRKGPEYAGLEAEARRAGRGLWGACPR